ncbi:MAG: DUF2892 domain-containing protein [Calditrichaeota bacterium]|nr:DUF2892 domain-containing protein [Calditrichota bacterium]
MINVGKIDRILRTFLGFLLIWLGLFRFEGMKGNLIGIAIAVVSLVVFYIVITGNCFIFRWFRIHSLSKEECERHGNPYLSD